MYIKNFESYSKDLIIKGIKKSVSKNDIVLNTNINNIIKNIESSNYDITSVEYFISSNDDFVSINMRDEFYDFVKKGKFKINTKKLDFYKSKVDEIKKLEKDIEDIEIYYSNSDKNDKKISIISDKIYDLSKFEDLYIKEILKIRNILRDMLDL